MTVARRELVRIYRSCRQNFTATSGRTADNLAGVDVKTMTGQYEALAVRITGYRMSAAGRAATLAKIE